MAVEKVMDEKRKKAKHLKKGKKGRKERKVIEGKD